MENKKLGNLLWEEPRKIKDYQGNELIEYQTKALDYLNDGISIYLNKKENRLTDLGYIINDLCSLANSEKAFFRKCDIIARKYFCNVTDDGELICNDFNDGLGIVEMIQAATALMTLCNYADFWASEDQNKNL